MSRAALYVRVSTGHQALDLQREELRGFAARREWTVAGEYEDVISGATAKRPGLDRLLQDGHAHQFDVVLVWKLDRLGRSLVHLVQVVEDLLSWGVDVVSATEPHMDSTTPQGRLLRNIFASVAEYERELIRERVRAGLTAARKHGTRSGKPIGRPRRAVDLEAVRRRRAAGESWRRIAQGMKVPTGTLRRYFQAGQNPPAELWPAFPRMAGSS